jgi:hypothetical protein
MILNEAVIEGTLNPDGTLELDQKPNLPPGRVKVVLQSEVESPRPLEDWWQFMQRSRRELESSGAHFLNELEVESHIEWLRQEDPIDERFQRPEPS